jgi:hypothetical protein
VEIMTLIIIISIIVVLILLPIIFMILSIYDTSITPFGVDDTLNTNKEQKAVKDAFKNYRK